MVKKKMEKSDKKNKKVVKKVEKKMSEAEINKVLQKHLNSSPIEKDRVLSSLSAKSGLSKGVVGKQLVEAKSEHQRLEREKLEIKNACLKKEKEDALIILEKEELEKAVTPPLPKLPSTPSTTFYIKSWGLYNKNKKILIEQINKYNYIYNINGEIGIAKFGRLKKTIPLLNSNGEAISYKEINVGYGFDVGDYRFFLHKDMKEPYEAKKFYSVPNKWEFEKWIKEDMPTQDYLSLHSQVKGYLKEMFDYSDEVDVESSGITIASSWIKVLLDSFFFLGIDATKGGGKTTLGENIYYLMRHGFVGGNISPSAFPRLIEELDLNIFVDEIDQNNNDDSMMSIMRKGQRRNNPYVRCEGNSNKPVLFEVAGIHGFSYRSDVEDAFLDRSIRMHTTKSSDSKLAIINSHKREILRSLSNSLWFWYIKNIFSIKGEEGCGDVLSKTTIPKRDFLFNVLVKRFSEEEKSYLKTVFGRDSELAYLCLNVTKKLKINFLEDLKSILKKKKKDSATSENFYNETIREYISINLDKLLQDRLKDGDNQYSAFYPKNKFFTNIVEYFKSLGVPSIGTRKFNSILRDLGFVEGETLTSQRYQGNPPRVCLIFGENVCKELGIHDALRDKIIEANTIQEEEKAKEEEPTAEEIKDVTEGFT